jgi:hypothetical protein
MRRDSTPIVNGRRKNGPEGPDDCLKNQWFVFGLDEVSQNRGVR